MGVQTAEFTAVSKVNVTLKINALNENTKTGSSTDYYTVYGLDANGEVVATVAFTSIQAGDNTVTLEGEGIVAVKIIMTGYPHNGNKYCNASLGAVALSFE